MMARMASADIMCVGSKSVKEKFSGIIRYVKVIVIYQSKWREFICNSIKFALMN